MLDLQSALPVGLKVETTGGPKPSQATVSVAGVVKGYVWTGSGVTWWFRTATDATYIRRGSPAQTFSRDAAVRALLTFKVLL